MFNELLKCVGAELGVTSVHWCKQSVGQIRIIVGMKVLRNSKLTKFWRAVNTRTIWTAWTFAVREELHIECKYK